jgi:hypothetical protein
MPMQTGDNNSSISAQSITAPLRSRNSLIIIGLLALWFVLNSVDLFSTYQALSTGCAAELNPLMAAIIGLPLLAVTMKMTLAYAAARIVERMAARNSLYAIVTVLMLNAFLLLVCISNFRVCFTVAA